MTEPCCHRLNLKMFQAENEVKRQARLASRYGPTVKRLDAIAEAKSKLVESHKAIEIHEIKAHSSQAVPA